MTIRRIFAGSIVALLLSVSALAAACDLSCAFASMNSDCHSGKTESQGLAPGGMSMEGMAMPGMAMQDMANGEDQQAIPAISRAKTSHPSIGEMGLCERQFCECGSAVSTKTSPFVDSRFHTVAAVAVTPRAEFALQLFHDARDDVARHFQSDGSPLQLSLRI